MNMRPQNPEISQERESYEHQDLRAAGILYFLLSLAVVTVLCMFGLKGFYAFSIAAREPRNLR